MMAAFLRVNGYQLMFDDLECYSFMIGLYQSDAFRFENLERWLRACAPGLSSASPFVRHLRPLAEFPWLRLSR